MDAHGAICPDVHADRRPIPSITFSIERLGALCCSKHKPTTLRSNGYCCKPCNESPFACWHIPPCPLTGILYCGRMRVVSSLDSCIGLPALMPNDGMPPIRHPERAQCTRADTRLFPSKRTFMSFAFVDMLSGMHSVPAWCHMPKTGVGRVFGGDAISALMTSCTIGQYRAQPTGLTMSISPSLRRNWKRCDGRFDAVHHLEAITGEPKEHGYWASALNSAGQGVRRRFSRSFRNDSRPLFTPLFTLFSRCSGRPARLRRRRRYVSRAARRLAPRC